jgi:hypothetical protein
MGLLFSLLARGQEDNFVVQLDTLQLLSGIFLHFCCKVAFRREAISGLRFGWG